MANWRVNRDNVHFEVASMAELRSLAQSGKLSAGDLVQAPGEEGWEYASSVPGLSDAFGGSNDDFDDFDDFGKSGGAMGKVWVALLILLVVGGAGAAVYFGQGLGSDTGSMFDEGKLSYSELIVTAPGAALREAPEANARVTIAAEKDSRLQLLAKRDQFYRVRTADGQEGYIEDNKVLPLYLLAGGDVKAEYDPLYNPDQYLKFGGYSWQEVPGQKKDEQVTFFEVRLENSSRYDMTGVKLAAVIKDSRGVELETKEFDIDGVVPKNGSTMVGTLTDPETEEQRLITAHTFQRMAEESPDLRMQYSAGAQVVMETTDFQNADLTILELQAIPE